MFIYYSQLPIATKDNITLRVQKFTTNLSTLVSFLSSDYICLPFLVAILSNTTA